VLVIERLEDAIARKAPIYAELLGYGMSCDANHMTIPHIDGVKRVMQRALEDAGLRTTEINYINAHGTGTPMNDRTEATAIREIFDTHTEHLPVSSIKSMIGHTMGAASALEAISCVLTVRYDRIPPTINFETPDPECNIDCVPNTSRACRVKIALNNSFALVAITRPSYWKVQLTGSDMKVTNPNIPSKCDVVVIGAGIGGLTCANYLAKSGVKVVLLRNITRLAATPVLLERNILF